MPEPATPVTAREHPEGDVDVDILQVVGRCAANLQLAVGCPHLLLEDGPVVKMVSGDGIAGPEPFDGSLEADGAACRTGARAEVYNMIGDGDRLRLVLDDEHRVALVP